MVVVGYVGGGGGGGRGIINTRNSIPYDIRLSIYSDSDRMGPEEVERRIVVEEKQMHHIINVECHKSI